MVSLYDIRLLYIREVRAALRERGVVFGSLLLPLLVYPVLLWLILSAFGFLLGHAERRPARIALVSLPAGHGGFEELLAAADGVDLVETPESAASREAALRDGTIDLVASFELAAPSSESEPSSDPPAQPPSDPSRSALSMPGDIAVAVAFNSAEHRSQRASRLFEQVLEQYRRQRLGQEASRLGIDDARWTGWRIELQNVASGEDVGAFMLGLLAPMLMMLMITVGCFYPAIDATAGERERSTWETSMTLGVAHGSLLVAKYLYVATLGGVAGLLNLAAMALSTGALLRPLLGTGDIRFAIPPSSLPLIVLASFTFALTVAAAMMLFAVFARTFKEGQSMITPVYLLSLLPPILVTSPDLVLDVRWALVPVANICLLFRQAITGQVDGALALLVLLVQGLTIALLLIAARWVMAFEDVAVGSYRGSLIRLLEERWRGRPGGGADA